VALQRPLDHGADVVAYAATKLMDGSGRTLSGAVVGSADFINGVLHPYTRNTGNVPFNAWIVLKGLETLDLRAKAQAASALDLGAWLEARVPRVLHPGLASHPQHDLAKSRWWPPVRCSRWNWMAGASRR
jgi:O-succinylhomoserine sulfhydrylase